MPAQLCHWRLAFVDHVHEVVRRWLAAPLAQPDRAPLRRQGLPGKTYKGCANPTKRIDRGEERHSDWCMVVPGSCEKATQHKARVPAGQNWDVCESLSTFKLKLHF